MTEFKPTWYDSTSYSQGERAQGAPPRSWSIESHPRLPITSAPGIVVTVHRLSGVENGWFLSCGALRIRDYSLNSTDIENAKVEALYEVKQDLQLLIQNFALIGVTP